MASHVKQIRKWLHVQVSWLHQDLPTVQRRFLIPQGGKTYRRRGDLGEESAIALAKWRLLWICHKWHWCDNMLCFSAPVAAIGPWPCNFRGQNSYIIMTWMWCWKDSQHLLIGHSDIWFPCCLPCWPCVVSLSSGIRPWHRPTGSFDDWAAHGCL